MHCAHGGHSPAIRGLVDRRDHKRPPFSIEPQGAHSDGPTIAANRVLFQRCSSAVSLVGLKVKKPTFKAEAGRRNHWWPWASRLESQVLRKELRSFLARRSILPGSG